MSVTSKPITRHTHDWPMLIAKGGVWLAVASFGGVFWAINGGFSVLGLGVVASSFNESGRLFWAALSAITFPVPVSVPGLPTAQPLIPWLGVIAASLLQIITVYMILKGRRIPPWLMIATGLLSLYDLGTTWFGLGTVAWIEQAGVVIQSLIAIVLTFIVEASVSFLLRR